MGDKGTHLRQWGRRLLFPGRAATLLLVPASAGFLICAMMYLSENHPARMAAYTLSTYALVICCARIPALVYRLRAFKERNRLIQRWLGDARLRMNVTLTGSILWNGSYALMQLGLCVYHRSLWFGALSAYYFLLAFMRFFLVRYSLGHALGQSIQEEKRRYSFCGALFLPMNVALSVIIFHMVNENRLVRHHEITTIAMAAYAFAALTMAIVNAVRYRKYNSPVLSASKAISLASASVSMLTLEGTMLATFGADTMSELSQKIFLRLSGAGISILIIAMALYMLTGIRKGMSAQKRPNI